MQEKRVYFDHDYAEEMQRKRKEYTPIKKVLKENKIRFQTPLTKMHLQSGTVTCNNSFEAAEDLAKRGFSVGPIRASRTKGITEETLSRLLPWSTVGARRAGNKPDFQEAIREKLRGFQWTNRNGAAEED